uniref:RIIa domain-containing protein n=1 Tax=Stomoxys calcitrans TaxID=35570 RepID=A0A1I8Q786_STOCA
MYSFAENYFQSLLSEKENYEVKGFELSNQKYNVVQSQCTQRFQIATIMAHSIVPENLTDLIKEFTKTTLRAQPQNLCEFAVEYFRQLRKSKKIVNSKDISYIEFDSYFKNKDRFLFTPFVRCLCGRTIGEGFNTNSRLDYVTSKREINNDIETKNVAYSSYITKSNECNENNNNTKPENELSEEYMNSIYLIQRFIRRYLTHKNLKLKSKKPQLPKTIMSEEQAALIIQRSLRKLFGCTNTSRPFETTDNLPVVPQLQLNHYENDSISEAASYTSASTAVLSASESSREVPEFSPAENIVKETIVEGEELENDNQNVIKCEHVNDSTCLECFQKGGFAKYSGRNIPVSGEENVAHDSQSDKEACSSRDLLDNEGNGTEIPFPFQEKEHSAPLSRTQENIDSMRTIAEMDEELVSSANIETEQKQNKDLHHIRQETTYGSNIEYNEVDNSSIENNTDTIAGQDGALISPENYENEQKKVTAEVNKDIHHIRQQTVYGSNVDFISEEEKNKTIDYEDCTFYEVEESSAHNKADTLPEKDRALISTKNHESEQNNVISEVNKDEFSRGEENNNNTVDKDCTFSEIEGTSMQNNGSSLPKKDGALTSPAKVIADVNKDKHHFQQNNADGSDTEFTIGKENNKIIVGMDCNLNEVEDSLIKNNALTEKNGALISPINHNHAQKKVIAEVNEDTQHIREKIGDGSNVEIRCGEENNKNIVDKDSTFNEVEDSSIRNNDIIFSEKDEALVLPANQENEQMKMIAELNSDIHHIRQQTADGSNAEFNSGEENNKDIVNTDFTFNEVKDNSIENNTDTLAEKNGSPLSPVNREHEQNNVFAEVNKDIHIIQHQTTDGSNVEFSSGEEHNKNIVDKDCVFSAVEDSSILNNVNSLIPEHTENVGHDSQDENEACSSRGLLDNDGNGTKISFSTESYLQEREHSLSLPRTQENIEPKGTLTENHGELISPAKHENVLNEVTSELNKEMYHIRHESADGPNAESSIEEENKIHIVDKDYNFREFDCSSIKNNGDAFAEKDGGKKSIRKSGSN